MNAQGLLFAAALLTPMSSPNRVMPPVKGSVAATAATSCTAAVKLHVVAAGGTHLQGAGGLAIDGTAGQSGTLTATGAGGWRLDGGFWSAARAPTDEIYCNGFD